MKTSFYQNIRKLWENAEYVLTVLLFATFPFNIRKVFLTTHSYPKGEFNEYMTFSLGLSDILMISVIIIYTIKYTYKQDFIGKLCNNKFNISSVYQRVSSLNVSRETLLLLLFLFFSLVSILWSPVREIALYRYSLIIELLAFFLIAYRISQHRVRLFTFIKESLIWGALFQSVISISQFSLNRSLGLGILGESVLSPNASGVAKILIDGEKHIRSYGTFPHPNILAGFLIIPLLIILVEILIPKLALAGNSVAMVPRGTFSNKMPTSLSIILFFIIATGFLLTVSRSAYLGLFLSLLILIYINKIIFWKKARHFATIMIFASILFFALNIHHVYLQSLFSNQSIIERDSYFDVSREIIYKNPLFGVGVGQFVATEILTKPEFQGWQYQPVHNIFLLITAELGTVGLTIILLLIFSYFFSRIRKLKSSKNLTYKIICCIMFSFFIIALFDHYFWDIKSGMIIFLIPLLLLKLSKEKKDEMMQKAVVPI